MLGIPVIVSVAPESLGVSRSLNSSTMRETPFAEAFAAGEVRKRIAQLPTRLREVLVLRTIEGLPQGEVAGMLGISEKAVEARLYRARRRREKTSR